MQNKILKIKDIFIDEELYPRKRVQQSIINDYATCLRNGDIFPKIWIGFFKGKLYLIDGRHRLEAHASNGEEYIQAEIQNNFKNKSDMFLASVRSNLKHGTRLTEKDKLKIAYKLSDLKINVDDIGKLMGFSSKFVDNVLKSNMNTKIIQRAVKLGKIKGNIKETLSQPEKIKTISKGEVDKFIKDNKEEIIISQIDNFIEMLQTEKLDMDDKYIFSRLRKIKILMKKKYPKL